MKTILTFMVLFAFSMNNSFAQNKETMAVQKALEVLKNQMLDPTEIGLKAIAHPGLTYGHSGGKVENQSEFMTALLTGTSDFTTLDFSDIKIEIAGKTAIVRHILMAESNDKGKQPAKVNLKVMLVFVKEKSGWVLFGRQAVKNT